MNEVPWPLQLNQESQTLLSRVRDCLSFLLAGVVIGCPCWHMLVEEGAFSLDTAPGVCTLMRCRACKHRSRASSVWSRGNFGYQLVAKRRGMVNESEWGKNEGVEERDWVIVRRNGRVAADEEERGEA